MHHVIDIDTENEDDMISLTEFILSIDDDEEYASSDEYTSVDDIDVYVSTDDYAVDETSYSDFDDV
jgi:hypothetical protein